MITEGVPVWMVREVGEGAGRCTGDYTDRQAAWKGLTPPPHLIDWRTWNFKYILDI